MLLLHPSAAAAATTRTDDGAIVDRVQELDQLHNQLAQGRHRKDIQPSDDMFGRLPVGLFLVSLFFFLFINL